MPRGTRRLLHGRRRGGVPRRIFLSGSLGGRRPVRPRDGVPRRRARRAAAVLLARDHARGERRRRVD
jgi:hypothetical protein